MKECPFKLKYKRIENAGICTAHDVDSWIKTYGKNILHVEMQLNEKMGVHFNINLNIGSASVNPTALSFEVG